MIVAEPFPYAVRGRSARAPLQRVWDAGKRVAAARGHRVSYTHAAGVAPF